MKVIERRLAAAEARVPAKPQLDLSHMDSLHQARLLELAHGFLTDAASLSLGDLDELAAMMLRAHQTPRPSAGHGSAAMAEQCCCSLCQDHAAAAA